MRAYLIFRENRHEQEIGKRRRGLRRSDAQRASGVGVIPQTRKSKANKRSWCFSTVGAQWAKMERQSDHGTFIRARISYRRLFGAKFDILKPRQIEIVVDHASIRFPRAQAAMWAPSGRGCALVKRTAAAKASRGKSGFSAAISSRLSPCDKRALKTQPSLRLRARSE